MIENKTIQKKIQNVSLNSIPLNNPDSQKYIAHTQGVTWIIKISKLCNLRCKYCYEFKELGNPKRIDLQNLRSMFDQIAKYYQNDPKIMTFNWHGGEPTLIEPEYYQEILKMQNEIFGKKKILFVNTIQTNLTILTDDIIDLLRNFFSGIGVSIDPYGDERIDTKGNNVEETVLQNILKLQREGIKFDCITVLSRYNMDKIEKIYSFFERLGIDFRILPIYRTGFAHQQDRRAMSRDEIIESYKKIIALMQESNNPVKVWPIQEYFSNVFNKNKKNDTYYYNKFEDELTYIVEPDGSLFSVSDPPDPVLCHGNIFTQSLENMKRNSSYQRAVIQSHSRMIEACSQCNYYGWCSGYYIGEATPEERYYDKEGNLICGVAKPIHEYVDLLFESDLTRKKSYIS